MIIRRIPMNALQKGVYSILTAHLEPDEVGGDPVPVYDDVDEGAVKPYISFGEFTSKLLGNKTTDISDISLQLHIWSDQDGKKQVNSIANDVVNILTAFPIDLSANGFQVMNKDVDFFEAFPEDPEGYHGVITFVCQVQNLGTP